ncbi:hypothetical protein EXIGLDRAFT_723459, partial [Exidia glandulosa HHB12029]
MSLSIIYSLNSRSARPERVNTPLAVRIILSTPCEMKASPVCCPSSARVLPPSHPNLGTITITILTVPSFLPPSTVRMVTQTLGPEKWEPLPGGSDGFGAPRSFVLRSNSAWCGSLANESRTGIVLSPQEFMPVQLQFTGSSITVRGAIFLGDKNYNTPYQLDHYDASAPVEAQTFAYFGNPCDGMYLRLVGLAEGPHTLFLLPPAFTDSIALYETVVESDGAASAPSSPTPTIGPSPQPAPPASTPVTVSPTATRAPPSTSSPPSSHDTTIASSIAASDSSRPTHSDSSSSSAVSSVLPSVARDPGTGTVTQSPSPTPHRPSTLVPAVVSATAASAILILLAGGALLIKRRRRRRALDSTTVTDDSLHHYAISSPHNDLSAYSHPTQVEIANSKSARYERKGAQSESQGTMITA